MPFDRAGLLPAQISPWAHINNFRPASEMRNGQRSWGRVQAQNSRNKANMAKQKVITFAPFIRLATHIAVSLQMNGVLMTWKIQQVKEDDSIRAAEFNPLSASW